MRSSKKLKIAEVCEAVCTNQLPSSQERQMSIFGARHHHSVVPGPFYSFL
jgi:hypothetical protein